LSTSNRDGRLMVTGEVRNPSSTPALMTRLTLRDTKSGGRILPVYYAENFLSLLPGENREFRIETDRPAASPGDVGVDLDGWNIKHATVR
jgi:hypothetical protein